MYWSPGPAGDGAKSISQTEPEEEEGEQKAASVSAPQLPHCPMAGSAGELSIWSRTSEEQGQRGVTWLGYMKTTSVLPSHLHSFH